MTATEPRLPPRAEIGWDDGVPHAARFDDIYYSRAGGLAETEAVFLSGCGLPAAWAGRRLFTIGELGFGAGLNALAAWRLWRQTRTPGAILHFVSTEAYPLDAAEARQAHQLFPEIAALSEQLIARWPIRMRGAQRIWFAADGFALTVLHGDALESLRAWRGQADCWFLDGFAPARNAAMWSAELLSVLTQRSAPDARLATYSVAGEVRRALTAAGWRAEKKPGFAGKRERLEARLAEAPAQPPSLFPRGPSEGRVAILGDGIAAASLVHALGRRGRDCVLISDSGEGASFNPAALVMPRLDRGWSAQARLHLNAFAAAAALYEALGLFEARGVLELPRDDAAMAEMLADPPLPGDWLAAGEGGALHKKAGVLSPRAVLSALSGDCPRIEARVHSFARIGKAWSLRDGEGREILRAETLVLANGPGVHRFAQSDWLPMRLSRGQIEFAPGVEIEGARVCGSYVAPARGGIVFGATFDAFEGDAPPMASEASRAENLAALSALLPRAHDQIHGEQMVSRASVRASLPDFTPIAGLMPDAPAWRAQNEDIAFGRPAPLIPAPCLKGVYVLGGLGARGFALAPALGEDLAAEICGEPQCLSKPIQNAVHPARFLLRALKKREGISS
ncbi:MAG: tRNA (5-methylaminomethyl-2-thiouridine)(34)-methyltransferase MnmD [Hyphomonadaceae bacterium]